MGVREDIMETYPTLAWLLNDPEVGPLLTQAVDPGQGFSPQTFQAKLYQTQWWRSRSQSAREFDILKHTDPGTYRQNMQQYSNSLSAVANRLGVNLTGKELQWISASNLRQGLSPEDPMTLRALVRLRRSSGGHQGAGAIRTAAHGARNRARGAYYLSMGDASAQKWGEWIALGERTQEDLDDYLRSQAARMYPHLGGSLSAGMTMQDIFSEHQAAIAEELELDPDRLNLMDGKWRKVLGVSTKNGMRPMSISEAQIYARQDDRFWLTRKGRQQEAEMTTYISNMFGETAL